MRNNIIQVLDTATDFDPGKNLLIVEDDDTSIAIIENYAQGFFNNIYTFSNAEQAKIFLSNNKELSFDLAIIDFFLPEQNADSLLSCIKKKDKKSQIFIISGDVDIVKKKTLIKGINGFIQKPLPIEYLYRIFKEYES